MKLTCTIPATAPGAVLSLKKDRASIDLTQSELDFLVNLADVLEITETEVTLVAEPVTEPAVN